MIQSILLAMDGSAAAMQAADFAASLALRFQSVIIVLNACMPARPPDSPGWTPRRDLDEARALVAGAARRLREMGVQQVESEVMQGPAVNVILGVAETRKPDLIVMGARGSSTWKGQTPGSVSMAVTMRAECPVLVVRPGQT